MIKTKMMLTLEHERHQRIEAILEAEFASGKTDTEIATSLGISRQSLYDWLELLGAEVTRTRSVAFTRELAGTAA